MKLTLMGIGQLLEDLTCRLDHKYILCGSLSELEMRGKVQSHKIHFDSALLKQTYVQWPGPPVVP